MIYKMYTIKNNVPEERKILPGRKFFHYSKPLSLKGSFFAQYIFAKVMAVEKEQTNENKYDVTKIYDYKEFPDKISGRCDNCGHALFKSSVKDFVFIRECRNCGMKKRI